MKHTIQHVVFRVFYLLLLAGFIAGSALFSQQAPLTFAQRQQYERGVRAFHSGSFNQSISIFQQLLNDNPSVSENRLWLGRSYLHAGFRGAAIDQLEIATQQATTTPHYQFLLQSLYVQQELAGAIQPPTTYLLTSELGDNTTPAHKFKYPAGIAVDSHGTYWVTMFGSHELLSLDVNGSVINRFNSSRYPFKSPFGILIDDNNRMLVSEFGHDRVVRFDERLSVDIRFNRAGSQGLLAGPQEIAVDANGNYYISDWGNERVVKFNALGNFIQVIGIDISIGQEIVHPAGIEIVGDILYVVDKNSSQLLEFELTGARRQTHELFGLDDIEGLSKYYDNQLLLTARQGIYTYHPGLRTLRQLATSGGGKITSAHIDANGTMIATDLSRNRILFYTPVNDSYSGMVVKTHTIDSSAFPNVIATVSVSDHFDNPMVGLTEYNFSVIENTTSYESSLVFESALEQPIAMAIIIPQNRWYSENYVQFSEMIAEITDELSLQDVVSVIYLGQDAILQNILSPYNAAIASILEPVLNPPEEIDATLDEGIQVAASSLLQHKGKRIIVYFDTDESIEIGTQLAPDIIADMLSLNKIQFTSVGLNRPLPAITEIIVKTEGAQIQYSDVYGAGSIVDVARSYQNGLYFVSYVSQQYDDFGRTAIPFRVNANLFTRSGSDSLVYYAPRR